MKYQVTLSNGQNFSIEGSFDVEQFTAQLNDRTAPFINLGGCIVNKAIVVTILPIETTE